MNPNKRLLVSAFLSAIAMIIAQLSVASVSVVVADEQKSPAAEAVTAENGTSSEHADAHAADAHGSDSHAADSHGGDAHAGEHHETGVPGFDRDLALWSVVVFGCFLFVLKKAAWAPMIQGLDKREAGIRQAIADAHENQRKATALLAEYDQKLKAAEQTVQAMVAEAKRDAERTSQDLITAAQKEVNAIRNRARDEIQQAKDAALAEVFSSVNNQVISATEHVLGRALTGADQDRFVQEALAGISR
jgi:F-type H+-transporting ATPase subunit b